MGKSLNGSVAYGGGNGLSNPRIDIVGDDENS
jgi:hypothetical protein